MIAIGIFTLFALLFLFMLHHIEKSILIACREIIEKLDRIRDEVIDHQRR